MLVLGPSGLGFGLWIPISFSISLDSAPRSKSSDRSQGMYGYVFGSRGPPYVPTGLYSNRYARDSSKRSPNPGQDRRRRASKELHDLLRIMIVALQREVLLNPNLPHSAHPHSHANPEFPQIPEPKPLSSSRNTESRGSLRRATYCCHGRGLLYSSSSGIVRQACQGPDFEVLGQGLV